jgi:pimeloyl-ACP methyl ester carboxylesterase
MDPVTVPTNSRLRVEYRVYKAQQPRSDCAIVLHHGIYHSHLQFLELIQKLNALGFHAVMIDQQSKRAGFFRNFIGAKQYRDGMANAVKKIETEVMPVGWYVLHSMGAFIGEEMQQHNPRLRRPTVFMAPIPVDGALPIAVRIFRRHPIVYLKSVLTLSTLTLAKKRLHVRELFFDSRTPEKIVKRTTPQLKHAPFWMFCQLLLRWALRPRIHNDRLKKMLIYSRSDEIFHVREYKKTIERFPQLKRRIIKGGHDFFIEFAARTAARIAQFCR